MGKLQLNHFNTNSQSSFRTSRRGGNSQHQDQSQTQGQTQNRFGALVGDNPFRAHRTSTNARASTTENVRPRRASIRNSNGLQTPANTHTIRSRESVRPVRQTVDINETSLFPSLQANAHTDDHHPVQPAPVANLGHWKRSGLAVLEGDGQSSGTEEDTTDIGTTTVDEIKPGWARISIHGIEYGPRSDNYERVQEAAMRARRYIHREMFARSRRIFADTYGDDTSYSYNYNHSNGYNDSQHLSDIDNDNSDVDNDNSDGESDQSEDEY